MNELKRGKKLSDKTGGANKSDHNNTCPVIETRHREQKAHFIVATEVIIVK